MKTKILLDSGNPRETKEVLDTLGFLDGQTTNPSLIAKSPEALARLQSGKKFTKSEVNDFYKEIITNLRTLLPTGSVSIEVYADAETRAEEMIAEGEKMNGWISGAHIKLPTTAEGLKAARALVDRGMNINMTLVFSQEQAAAVYAATRGAKKGQVFLSPFIGRLDDIGENGMDLIKNVIAMYQKGDGHVEVLTASVRSLDHFLAAIALGSDSITSPKEWILAWHEAGRIVPSDYTYARPHLAPILYEEIDLGKEWNEYDIVHELTTKGLTKFASDWNGLVG